MLLQRIRSFKRPYNITSGEANLEMLMEKFINSFQDCGRFIPHVLVFDGLPGSGKSFYQRDSYNPLY